MKFEPSEVANTLGPSLVEQVMTEIPIFGPEKAQAEATADKALQSSTANDLSVENSMVINKPLPESYLQATTTADKLRALRRFIRLSSGSSDNDSDESQSSEDAKPLEDGMGVMSLASKSLGSCHEFHESSLGRLMGAKGLPREAQNVIDHTMLFRAKEGYLFDAHVNREIVADDAWLRFAWDWVAGISKTLPLLRMNAGS